MNLCDVYTTHGAGLVLYELLAERPRENWISHGGLPPYADHCAFVDSHPFLMWYLIIVEGDAVGAIEVTDRNEIGVAVFDRYKRRGYATQALRLFMDTHRPLPAIPAIRNGHWLANVAMGNKPSRLFFWKAGFRPIQETYCHD